MRSKIEKEIIFLSTCKNCSKTTEEFINYEIELAKLATKSQIDNIMDSLEQIHNLTPL